MKTYSDSYLMSLKKEDLINLIRCAEHNKQAAEATLEQHIENVKDWQPVVRCKDCKYVCDYTDIYPKSEGYKCIKNGNFHDENWYCADGERKTDESTN